VRVGIPIAALAAMIAGWLIGRWALQPLMAMAADAAAIDHRSLENRLPVTPQRDELGRLGAAFNALLDRLVVVLRAQRRFMADASHELRTPVSVARTAAQVTLSTTTRTEAEYRDSLEVIATQMRRLTRVVDDMFMLALADLDARPLEARDLYLDEIVGDCVRAATVLASARNVRIDYGHVGEIAARGDEALLRQLVMNLLDNAVRHTPSAGTVTVSLQRHDGRAELAVEDSGPGVPAAEQGRVFERFVRLAPSGAGGGAGLGLAIARWVAEQHGGRLSLGGEGDASSRFVLTLPV
jgi:signal transduction histidine kinase